MPLLLLLNIGCAVAPGPSTPPCPGSPTAPPPASAPVALPTEADVIRWSHDAIDAWDRGDAAALGAVLSEGSWDWEDGAPDGRGDVLAGVAKRKSPIFDGRVWSNEHVQVREPFLIFVGEAKEHQAGNTVHGGYDMAGGYSLIWCREGDAYKIAFWSWHVAALDVGMGQGRNALYLASHGWKVTGVDLSEEGIRAAREAAAARHLQLDAVNADLETYDLGVAKWDLVTLIYAPHDGPLLERVKRSMKAGALVVYDGFADEDDSFATGKLAALFKDGFDVVRDEVDETTPDWKRDHAKVEHFVARKR